MRVLILTTYSFPYGQGETFLANELPYLSKVFQKIILVPENVTGVVKTVPSNCEVRLIAINNHFPLKKIITRFGVQAIKRLFYCWRNDNTPEGKVFYAIKKWKIRWLDLLGEHFKGTQLVTQLPELKSQDTLLYHYWMIDFARYFSWMKQAGVISNKLVCRIHGYDFNPTRQAKNHFIFREAELNGYNKICAASNFGLKLIQELHPEQHYKTSLNRLGVNIPDIIKAQEISDKNSWVFVSCSSIIEEKRVDKIAGALLKVAFNNPTKTFHWHHFGDGGAIEKVNDLVQSNNNDNLHVTLHGNVSNQTILDFYNSEQVDAFIHASITEGGCPVAIQEAFAYGIPLVGLANEGTVELAIHDVVQLNCDHEEIIKAMIEDFIKLPSNVVTQMKFEVYNFAKKHFNSQKNYCDFITNILLK